MDPETVSHLMDVRPEYLATYWSEIERDSGSVDGYLRDRLGVSDEMRERLRAALTE